MPGPGLATAAPGHAQFPRHAGGQVHWWACTGARQSSEHVPPRQEHAGHAFLHIARPGPVPVVGPGVTMSAWSISTQCFPTYDGVARAKHLAAAGALRLPTQGRAGPGCRFPAWPAACTRCPTPTPDSSPSARRPAEPACVTRRSWPGLWVLEPPPQPHIAVTHSRRYPGFVCHRSAAPPTLLDTVVQSLRCLPELDGLVIAESAVVLKGMPLAGAASEAARSQTTRRSAGWWRHRPAIAVHY